jgi:hypothetical protein
MAIVPVYYLGQDGTRLALFREFHRTDVSPGRLQAAINQALDPMAPLDPDLSAPWGPGPAKVTVDGLGGPVVTIDLPASAGVANGRTPQQAALAAQQLVWTASAVEQDAHLHVRLLIDGQAGRLFGTLPVGTTMQRTSPSYLVLGSIWVESPAEGQTVASPVTVQGSACTFEANVAWQLLSGDQVVRSGHTTASIACPDRGTWSVALGDLPAGSYTFRAFEPPASGEGPDREDTRTFTVR